MIVDYQNHHRQPACSLDDLKGLHPKDQAEFADDERFRAVPAKWVFWAISSDMDQVVARKVSQRDRARGILFQDEEQQITIWIKTWSQIVNDCRSRLKFFAEKLNYTPDRDSSLAHLKTTYHKYLADLFAPRVETVGLGKHGEE